jgi:hypothetical protein
MNHFAKTLAMMSLMLCFATGVYAQTWRTGKVYNTNGGELSVVPRSMLNSTYTWYDPGVYQFPNGDLGFIAQAGNPSVAPGSNAFGIASASCGSYAPAGIDTFYSARRDQYTGAWTTPAFGACPTLKGQVRRCTYEPQVRGATNIDPVGGPSIVRIANPNSASGYRYYMAFNGGNADYITGKLYWAVSDDGTNWAIYNWNVPAGYQYSPIIGPEYHDCNGGKAITKHDEGVAEPMLVFDPSDTAGGVNPNGTFYLYFMYSHYTPSNPDNNTDWSDAFAFRFGYNPGHPFGFGGNNQIFHDGAWRAHSGRLVFTYDAGPVVGSDPRLDIFHSMTSIANSSPSGVGVGDIKQNPITKVWVKITTSFDQMVIQTTTRLDLNAWSAPNVVDMTSVNSLYSPWCVSNGKTANVIYGGGLWYGTLGGRQGWWFWLPVNASGSTNCFEGIGIVVMKLCENNEANCDL